MSLGVAQRSRAQCGVGTVRRKQVNVATPFQISFDFHLQSGWIGCQGAAAILRVLCRRQSRQRQVVARHNAVPGLHHFLGQAIGFFAEDAGIDVHSKACHDVVSHGVGFDAFAATITHKAGQRVDLMRRISAVQKLVPRGRSFDGRQIARHAPGSPKRRCQIGFDVHQGLRLDPELRGVEVGQDGPEGRGIGRQISRGPTEIGCRPGDRRNQVAPPGVANVGQRLKFVDDVGERVLGLIERHGFSPFACGGRGQHGTACPFAAQGRTFGTSRSRIYTQNW